MIPRPIGPREMAARVKVFFGLWLRSNRRRRGRARPRFVCLCALLPAPHASGTVQDSQRVGGEEWPEMTSKRG